MSALPDLRGKVAVVTGGASGIGMGIARQLIAEGMQVVIGDIEAGLLRKAADDLGAVGILTDVSDLDSVRALARSATERFGTVHVVCNNAGVGPLAAIADLTMADWHWIIGVNLYGVIHGVQTFLPVLQANEDGGHIVNTASMAGLVAPPRLGAYSVTKFGVVALTEVLAAELAQTGSKVGVSVLCPGVVRTNIGTSSRNRPAHLAAGPPGRRRAQRCRHRAGGQPALPVDQPAGSGRGGGPRHQARRPVRAHPPGLVPHGRAAPPGPGGRLPAGYRGSPAYVRTARRILIPNGLHACFRERHPYSVR